MSETLGSLKNLIDKSQDYLETKIEITKLKTIDKSSDVLSSMIVIMTMMFGVFFLLVFLSAGLSLYLGYLMGKYYYGFFIVGGFYGLLVIILFAFKDKWIKAPITNLIIKKMLN